MGQIVYLVQKLPLLLVCKNPHCSKRSNDGYFRKFEKSLMTKRQFYIYNVRKYSFRAIKMLPIYAICSQNDNIAIFFVQKFLIKFPSCKQFIVEIVLTLNNVNLPSKPNEFEGYLAKCFRKFTVLPRKLRKAVSGSQCSKSW